MNEKLLGGLRDIKAVLKVGIQTPDVFGIVFFVVFFEFQY